MGIMSKGSQRLSERPLPPSTAERDSDILSVDDSDIVFSLGQQFLADYYQVSPSTTPTTESSSSNTSGVNTSSSTTTNTSNASLNSSTDSDISQDQVKQSYDDVVRLMSLYSSLKHVPAELEEKYSSLKSTADELSGSISELRSLSLSFGVADNSHSKAGKQSGKTKDLKKGGSSKTKTRKKM